MHRLFEDCQSFAALVEKYFGFLEEYEFRRSPEHEVVSGTLCKLVYLKGNTAIEIYLDIRDEYVGVNFVKMDEKVCMDLGAYLKKLGYFERPPFRRLPSPVESSLATWADLLRLYATEIFTD